MLMLCADAAERGELEAAAEARGLALRIVADAPSALLELEGRWPAQLVLSLGHPEEEETALLCRAARRRAASLGEPLRIVMVERAGATLVESEDEARALGADALLSDLPAEALLEALLPGDRATHLPPEASSLEEGSTGRAAVAHSSTGDAATAVRSMPSLGEMLERVRHADYFEILGVEREADAETLGVAYVRLRQRFAPQAARSETARAACVEISDALADAWHVLGDARLRRSYRDALPPRERVALR